MGPELDDGAANATDTGTRSAHRRSSRISSRNSLADDPDRPKFTTKSLLQDAAEDRNFNALKEGLKYALGTSNHSANWLPAAAESVPEDSVDRSIDGASMASGGSRSNPLFRDNLSPFRDPTASASELKHRSPLLKVPSANRDRDLESGLLTPTIEITEPEFPASPAKLGDMISRVSERIAGTGTPTINVEGAKSPSLKAEESDLDDISMVDSMFHRRKDQGLTAGLGVVSANNSSVSVPSIQVDHEPITHNILNPQGAWDQNIDSMYLFGRSLGVFPPTSRIRQTCHKIISHKSTSTFLLILVFLQTALLTYRHWNPAVLHGYMLHGNNWADVMLIMINIVYTAEMAAKIIAYGFYDDHIMFEELGLPYPANRLLLKFIPENIQRRLVQLFRFLRNSVGPKSKRPLPHWSSSKPTQSDPNSSEEIELQNLNGDHSGLDHSHHDTTGEIPRLQRSTNTFIKKNHIAINNLHLRRAYIRNSWHRIDCFSIIMFWLSLFLSIRRYDANNNITIFRALSTLRILRLCNLTGGTHTILTALKLAIPQLIDISIFIGWFWVFFAIIGVQSFNSSFRRHCVWTNPNDPSDTYDNGDQLCGSYLGLDGIPQPYLLADGTPSSSIKGFRCPMYSRCETLENPHGGSVSFDNIFHSLEMVFIFLSGNTFTDIMYNTMDTDNLAASLFAIFTIFILTVWLLNVFVAIIVSSFHVTRSEVAKEKSQKKDKLQMLQAFGNPEKREVTMRNEQLEELKKQKKFLALYYRFEFLFITLIFVDLATQCFRDYNMKEHRAHTLYRLESAFTLTFFIEIILRFVLYFPRWRLFFSLKRNCFDLFLAVFTGVIILDPIKERLGHAYYWLTVFQLMRFYRVVLAIPVTSHLWLKIMGNFKALFDSSLFFFLLLYLVSIIYARFFEGSISPEDMEDGGFNYGFQTLPNAFVALYIITSTENWTDILYNVQQYQNTSSARVLTAMLLISWFILSNFVILNLFVAIIASSLEVFEADKKKRQLMQFIENITTSIHSMDNESGALAKFKNQFFKRRGAKEEFQMAVVNLLLSGTAVNDFLDTEDLQSVEDDIEVQDLPRSKVKRWFKVNYSRLSYVFGDPFSRVKPKKLELSNFDPTDYAKNILDERNKLIHNQNQFLQENPTYNKVFYVMAPRHKIRRFCQNIVASSFGERIDGVEPHPRVAIIFVVFMFLMSIALVVTACYVTPLYRKEVIKESGYWNWSFYVECVFVGVFSIEAFIKVLADGLMFTPNGYTRSYWNLIDSVVLVALWIEFIAYLRSDGNLSRIFRGLKAFRALRLLTISETAKNNFQNTMIFGAWKIANAGILSLCLLFPFSIWGLNIFNGRLGVCSDGNSTMDECYNEFSNGVYDWEILSPNVYGNPQLHFNSFSNSLLSLFEITSLEGWTDLLDNVMQSTGIGTVPETFVSPINGFFVILFNFIGIVFILALFISVIIRNYAASTGRAYMTDEQISWYHVKRYLLQTKPSKRKDVESLGPITRICYNLTIGKNKPWSYYLNTVLFLHVIALLLEAYNSPKPLGIFRLIIYLFTTLSFSINSIMLMIAQGPKVFVKYVWSMFQLIVSVAAFVSTIAGVFVDQGSVFTNFNKTVLVGMLFFTIPRSNRLSQLLKFASASLPHLLSLLFTWVVLFLVIAIAMNQVFGTTKIGPSGSDNINVRSVPKAMILLFRCSFGEGWNYIMYDYTVEEPYCYMDRETGETDCGRKPYAYILFIVWNIVSMYIFLNMFISLILDSFSYIMNKDEVSDLISREEIRKFKRKWQLLDPEGTGYIPPKMLPKFLHSLDGSLSFHFYTGELEIPVLCNKWFIRNNSSDPYDITPRFDEIDASMDSWDVPKIRERRQEYERFMEEALLTMELNNDPGVSFSRILLQLPLYKTFEPGECLNLIDFLERTLLLQKVRKRLHTRRVYETIAAYACRWKYRQNQSSGIRDTNINFDSALNRRSYLSGERSPYDGYEDFADDDISLFECKVESEDEDRHIHRRSGVYVPASPVFVSKKKTPTVGTPRRLFEDETKAGSSRDMFGGAVKEESDSLSRSSSESQMSNFEVLESKPLFKDH